ncbi:MAG: hypothetical protein JST58_12420 [Bacteroidetes bacterium]|nr:hypothetical protein [Bacteroidota bacterium]
MPKEEIMHEINKALGNLSDEELQNLMAFLKNKEEHPTIPLFDKTVVSKILTEDKTLLQKLAK